jgi:opacity protein-like surface antigen
MIMKLLAGAILVLGGVSATPAQEATAAPTGAESVGGTFSTASFSLASDARFPAAASVRDAGDLFGAAAASGFNASASAAASSPASWSSAGFAMPAPVPSAALSSDPDPAPDPKFLYGGRDDYRWQLGLGASWERFRSSIFNASAVGINTSISYYLNNWLGIEGNVLTAFAPEIFDHEHVKLFNFTGGPRIAWRQRRWEPWLHGLVGVSHEQPQTAGNSKTAFASQLGGGADYRINPRLSLRLQGDWLHTLFFSQSQNNFVLVGGAVIHF